MEIQKGEVWIYFDEDAQKRRPGVIVGKQVSDPDIVLAKITTHDPRNKYDLPLEEWKEHGLAKPSIVRCSKLFTINAKNLAYKVATIEGNELEKIKQTIASYILD